MEDTHKYDDIIELEHPTSRTHPRMSAIDRAAQFAPFAALTGYHEMIADTTVRHNEEPAPDDFYDEY